MSAAPLNPADLVRVAELQPTDSPLQFRARVRVPVMLRAPAAAMLRAPSLQGPGETATSRQVYDAFKQRAEAAGLGIDRETGLARSETHALVSGISSSTSVDWYGTRMSLQVLGSMEEQFRAGIDYLPRHHGFWEGLEWSDVIGRTVDARIERRAVKAPLERTDPDQAVLITDTLLDLRTELGAMLYQRVVDNEAPGQSIGGWFTEMAFIFDDDDEIVDMIVLGLQLDHLAAVRSPANPDADDIFASLSTAVAQRARDAGVWPRCRPAASPQGRGISLGGAALAARSTEAPADPSSAHTDEEPPVIDEPEVPETEPTEPAEARPESAEADPEPPIVAPAEIDEPAAPALEDETAEPEPTPSPSDAPADEPSPAAPADVSPAGGDPAPRSRDDLEIDMDPKDLAALLGEAIAREIRPLAEKVEGLASRSPSTPATPAPTDSRDAELAALQAELEALKGAPAGRAGSHRTNQPAAPVAEDRHIDMREYAPTAWSFAYQSRGTVPFSPALMVEMDGVRSVAEFCRAAGVQGTEVATVVLDNFPELAADHNADDHIADPLRSRGERELKSMLRQVFRAAERDGLIRDPRTTTASWR